MAKNKYNYLEKWVKAENYMGADHSDSYVVVTKSRDSDLIDQVNFDSALEELDAWENSHIKGDHHFVINNSHWLVGWIEYILITPCEDCSDEDFHDLCEWVDDNISQVICESGIINEDKFSEKENEKFSDEIQEWIHDWVSYQEHRIEDDWQDVDVYGRVEELVSDYGRDLEHIREEDIDNCVEKVFKDLGLIDSLKNLKLRAEECAESRNHVLGSWDDIHTDYWKISHMNNLFNDEEFNPKEKVNVKYSDAICISCKREVRVTVKPLPNEIDIAGEALAIGCY